MTATGATAAFGKKKKKKPKDFVLCPNRDSTAPVVLVASLRLESSAGRKKFGRVGLANFEIFEKSCFFYGCLQQTQRSLTGRLASPRATAVQA